MEWRTEKIVSAAALIAKFMRGGAGRFAEEAGEVGRVGEGELLRDFLDRLSGEDECALGLGEHALTDEMTGGDAGCTFDVVVEPIDGHAEFVGVERKQALGAEKLV